ncbi:hypothetical protein P7C70_g6931, partial [Phenoliferia sp. Uapishka_3]
MIAPLRTDLEGILQIEDDAVTSARRSQIAWVVTNCASPERLAIAKELMDEQLYPVVSGGKCLNNMQENLSSEELKVWNRENNIKETLFRASRYCLVFENSRSLDYVTEKVWDALKFGCIPIYAGTPNFIQSFAPHPKSVIMYDDFGSPAALAAFLHRLDNESELRRPFLDWRKTHLRKKSLKLSQISFRFKGLHTLVHPVKLGDLLEDLNIKLGLYYEDEVCNQFRQIRNLHWIYLKELELLQDLLVPAANPNFRPALPMDVIKEIGMLLSRDNIMCAESTTEARMSAGNWARAEVIKSAEGTKRRTIRAQSSLDKLIAEITEMEQPKGQ